jgi:3-mercaptopyruvate sulfurtransferase SseA
MAALVHDLAPEASGSEGPTAGGTAPQVVVMGRGPFDWRPLDAAIALQAAGVPGVAWFRGGEDAWAAAGSPADDRRTP